MSQKVVIKDEMVGENVGFDRNPQDHRVFGRHNRAL